MIEALINNIDTIILAFVQGAFGSLTPIVKIMWRLMFIIFIAVYGYKVIISGRFAVNDLILNSLKIIILLLIATEWDTFFLIVYNMATDLPSDIAGQIMTGHLMHSANLQLLRMTQAQMLRYQTFMTVPCRSQLNY